MATASNTSSSSKSNQDTTTDKTQASTLVDQGSGGDSKEEIREFVRVGRTGRRNAVADVNFDPNLHVSMASLSELMCKFDCGDSKEKENADH